MFGVVNELFETLDDDEEAPFQKRGDDGVEMASASTTTAAIINDKTKEPSKSALRPIAPLRVLPSGSISFYVCGFYHSLCLS